MSAGSAPPEQDTGPGTSVRVLGRADHPDVARLLAAEPALDVFVASRLEAAAGGTGNLGGELWGYHERGRLVAACYVGANIVPVRAAGPAAAAFAHLALTRPRRCSSIVGRAEDVLAMWQVLAPVWGTAREVRADQPLMVLDGAPALAVDPGVRPVRVEEIDTLLPAAVAMFTEEVGVSPIGADGGSYYRARMTELVRAGRSLARFDDGEIVFKAEIGAASGAACQVQGVWVRPDRRGQGLAAPGMAAVAAYARTRIAPVVSLYVNGYNTAARAAYRRAGFRDVARFATVLF